MAISGSHTSYCRYAQQDRLSIHHETCMCNVNTLIPHFYFVKLGITGVDPFLIFDPKHRLWVLILSFEKKHPIK